MRVCVSLALSCRFLRSSNGPRNSNALLASTAAPSPSPNNAANLLLPCTLPAPRSSASFDYRSSLSGPTSLRPTSASWGPCPSRKFDLEAHVQPPPTPGIPFRIEPVPRFFLPRHDSDFTQWQTLLPRPRPPPCRLSHQQQGHRASKITTPRQMAKATRRTCLLLLYRLLLSRRTIMLYPLR